MILTFYMAFSEGGNHELVVISYLNNFIRGNCITGIGSPKEAIPDFARALVVTIGEHISSSYHSIILYLIMRVDAGESRVL